MADLAQDSEYRSRSSLLGLVEVTCSPSTQTTLLKFSLWVSTAKNLPTPEFEDKLKGVYRGMVRGSRLRRGQNNRNSGMASGSYVESRQRI